MVKINLMLNMQTFFRAGQGLRKDFQIGRAEKYGSVQFRREG